MFAVFDEYITALLLVLLTTLFLAFASLRYRHTPGCLYFIITMFLCAFMAAASIGEALAAAPGTKIVWRNMQQIPLISFPLLILAFVLSYVGKTHLFSLKRVTLISIPAAAYLVLIFTDSWHHGIRHDIELVSAGRFDITTVESTTLSILFIVYLHALDIFSLSVLFLNYRNTSSFNKTPYLLLIVGVALPVLFAIVRPVMPPGLWGSTAVSFIPSSLLLFLGLSRYGLFSLWPVAKDMIIENLRDGIVLIDKEDIIIEMNSYARKWLQSHAEVSTNLQTGTNLSSLLNPIPALQTFIAEKQKGQTEIHLVTKKEEAYFDISMFPIAGRNGHTIGFLIMVTDMTADKIAKNLLWEQAVTDPLTRLPNRQYFFEQAEKVKESDVDSEIAFILLDIDDFKKINDTYGHHIGDEVLICFSKMLQQMNIPYQIASRIGGEEFALLLTGINHTNIRAYGEYICREISSSPILISDQLSVTITVSLGISSATSGSASIEQMYREADGFLYYSKRHGKNQVSFQT